MRMLAPAAALSAAALLVLPASAQTRVNAPVAPDTIYVGRHATGVSVIDLNGFGQSTGDPTFDFAFGPGSEGHTKFPWNPNLLLQGSLLVPPLSVGTTTLDGGSAGVFTLTKDSDLDDVLLGAPDVEAVGDMMLGRPLDAVINDAQPFGCQAGGGNLCAATGLKTLSLGPGGPNTLSPFGGLATIVGAGNTISFAPHPNPPPILATPLCARPLIPGQEPTSVVTSLPPPFGPGVQNLLVPGTNPLGNPAIGLPPSSLLTPEQNLFFQGPSPPQSSIAACQTYGVRQQIGHFLYVADPAAEEIVVVNSNTFGVLARIPVEDPCELAMEPNLRLLAVTSRFADEVVFIDLASGSSTFHQVVKRTKVGAGPCGIAWDGAGEDILVCCENDDSVAVLSGFTLDVRKVVSSGLARPFAVAMTPRQTSFGFARNVYFAYILDRTGRVALFESGPAGINGWGFDDIVGYAPFVFPHPRAIQPDPLRLGSGVWIAHEARAGGRRALAGGAGFAPAGAVSNLVLDSGPFGVLPLNPGEPPSLRGLTFAIEATIGGDRLSGVPYDLAFDDQRNLGALPNFTTPFSPTSGAATNGKSLVRVVQGTVRNTSTPRLLFVPVHSRGPGVIDVIDLTTLQRVDTNPYRPGVQSIPAAGALGVMDYFRQ